MTASLRILCALLAFTLSVARPVHAFTVTQMKEMEAKVKKLVAVNLPAVVSLIGEAVPGAGSGVIVSEDGLILTAGHVTYRNDQMTVVFPNGKQVKCKVLGTDYTRDVGLAKIIEPGKYPFAEMGDSDKLETTSIVVALGHPGGFDMRRPPPARIGRISSKNAGGFLVSDCTLIGGDSGGPLFDLDGKVVGIHSSISESLSYNRDAPVNAAKVSWEKMLKGERWGKVPGQRPSPFSRKNTGKAVLGAVFDTSGSDGTVLKEVQPKSPLEAAGVRAGDVILRIGGEEMTTSEAVAAKVGKSRPGDRLALLYRRGDEEKRTEVILISESEMLKRMEPAEPKKP
jgi:serine protease Do